MAPFTYLKKGKPVEFSYWEVPPEVLESDGDLLDWSRRAWQAARRARASARPLGEAKTEGPA